MYEAILLLCKKTKTNKLKQTNHAVIKGRDILSFKSLVLFCKIPVHFHDKSCVKYSTNK